MELHYLLYLFVLNDFVVGALHRVERAANCPDITTFPGRVRYRRKGTRAVFKCPKKFDRYGPKFALCQDDGTWSNEPPLCTKTGCVPLDQSLVSNLIMDVVNQAVVKFSCEQNYHLIGETLAYCNGKDWSAPLPRCAAPHELTECDFEDDLCGWTQDDSDEQDWIRNVGPTPTGNTGPKYDHTYGDTGNGHYLFFETSNPTMEDHQAILYSPIYDEHLSPMCFDFWYHILGPDEKGHVGSLEVYVLDQSQFIDDNDIQPLFVKEGNQGDKWQRGDIFIETQVESYQIVIVATRAMSYISDIAIDDVRLYNCSRQNMTARTTSTAETSTTPISSTTESSSTTTTQMITSTTTILSTNAATETSTQSPTKITNKNTNTTVTPTTTIKTTAQSMSTSQVPDSTKAVSSTAKSSTRTLTTKISTQTRQKTNPDTTTVLTTTPTQESSTVTTPTAETTRKGSAKTTLKSTSTTISKAKLSSSTTKSTTTSTLSTSTTSSTTTTNSSPSTSVSTKASTTTPVKTIPPSSEKKTPSTSTSQTASSRKISSTTTTPMLKSTRTLSSTSLASTSSSTRIELLTRSQSSTVYMTDITGKERAITKSQKTTAGNTQTTLGTTKVSKPTKRTNAITTKSSVASNTTKDNSISVTGERSQHPEDETLKPLLIGLCVGIVAGLIIIGVIAYVCVRRRKFYTSRYEDELKPITNSASVQSLNNGHYYQDEEYESES